MVAIVYTLVVTFLLLLCCDVQGKFFMKKTVMPVHPVQNIHQIVKSTKLSFQTRNDSTTNYVEPTMYYATVLKNACVRGLQGAMSGAGKGFLGGLVWNAGSIYSEGPKKWVEKAIPSATDFAIYVGSIEVYSELITGITRKNTIHEQCLASAFASSTQSLLKKTGKKIDTVDVAWSFALGYSLPYVFNKLQERTTKYYAEHPMIANKISDDVDN